MGDTPRLEYGPDTAAVNALLDRAEELTQAQLFRLKEAYLLTRGEGEHVLLRMPRDYSWDRFHVGLREHGLVAEFDTLWHRKLKRTWPLTYAGCAIRDAACATLLSHVAGSGSFRVADLDLLLAPWRAVVDGCARSRLAIAVAHEHPYEVHEAWWAVVDAALANPTL